MIKQRLSVDFEWYEYKSDYSDVLSIDVALATRILFDMFAIREFEHALLRLKDEGCIHGPVHTCVGEESNGAAAIAALRKSDKVSGTHRAHHQFISKLMWSALPESWNPLREDLLDAGQDVLRRTVAEILGLATGYCGGHGGSMHLRHAESGFIGSNAVVGGGIPIATGVAFAEKHQKRGNVVLCFFGDGASNQGTFHEACNMAGTWKLPIIYFIENNCYAGTTKAEDVCAVQDLSLRASAYGMSGFIVDGMDPIGIYETVREVVASVRNGGVPCIIESKCYRYYHHIGGQSGSELGYRSKKEEEIWWQKDAVQQFPAALVQAGKLSEQDVNRIRELARTNIAKAVDSCTITATVRTIRTGLWPRLETIHEVRRSAGFEWEGIEFTEPDQFRTVEKRSYAEAVAAVITRWFEKDASVVLLGEEVADPGSILDALPHEARKRYRAQVLDTPISEAGFVGLSCGAALSGMRPIVEIMYSDFVLVAADQLFNQIDKIRSIYGNTIELPIVVRTKVAIGFGYGGQHSMGLMGLFSLFPGWRVVVPSTAADYIGLFNTAMQSVDPVLIVEHRSLYEKTFFVPKGNLDYFIRFGKARIVKSGEHVTVITYGVMVKRCEDLLPRLTADGVSAEIIDLRTVDPYSLDYETIGISLRKTGKAIIVEEAAASQCVGKVIAANLTERYFDYLESPIKCMAAADVPPAASPILESAFMINDAEIVSTLVEAVRRRSELLPPWQSPLPLRQ